MIGKIKNRWVSYSGFDVCSLLFSPKFDSLWKFRFVSVDIIKNLYTKRDKGDGVTKCPLLYIFLYFKLIVAFSLSDLVRN